jgi:hypothetical protein
MKTPAHDTTGLSSIRTCLRMAVPIMVYTTDPNESREGAMQRLLSRAALLLAAVVLSSCSNAAPSANSSSSIAPGASAAPAPAVQTLSIKAGGISGCVSPRERQAFEVYALRTQAMVGAQSCRITERFNAFATRFRGELTTEGQALRGYYQKNYGKRGDANLDEFVTELSNASFVNGGGAADYCGATNTLFDGVMAAPIGRLAAFSHEHPARALPAMEICTSAPPKKP